MGNQVLSSVENNFTKGLVTEFTGLNFPENAATDCDNCEFTLVGDVKRRLGINFEAVSAGNNVTKTNQSISGYKWDNVGGDSLTQLVVEQIGKHLYFYVASSTSSTAPLSAWLMNNILDVSAFVAPGNTFDDTLECEFADGNGYLFVFHPSCDPFYVTYLPAVPTNLGSAFGTRISVQIRDFQGVPEASLSANFRPTSLTAEHNYNLINQGWVAGNPWFTASTSTVTVGLGSKTFTVDAGLSAGVGNQVTIYSTAVTFGLPVTGPMMSGNVTAYAGTTMTINVTSGSTGWFGAIGTSWSIIPRDTAYISTWFSAVGNYPSNADVWWYFKNASGAFDPATTNDKTSLGAGQAPRGHFILDAFSQQRDVVSNLAITDIETSVRPRTGTWFQGRIWYTGVDARQAAAGDVNAYTWTENIYFSQIVNNPDNFGHCYQNNDPTSENLFDLLPTDGGVITIQGCGSIRKLIPIQNGLLVFANGVWFITGSQGIGFTANDYTITKISDIKSISSTSFVMVQGLPYFWNEEGIYSVQPTKGGGLEVDPITVGTILSFYDEIPLSSKKYARGAYHPIEYKIQWLYRDTEATDVTGRYTFNRILNFNTYNKAFFPYSVTTQTNMPSINGIVYVNSPGGITAAEPALKYFSSFPYIAGPASIMTFSQERDDTYVDWAAEGGINYESYFITGYKLHGQAQRRFQIPYIYVFSRADTSLAYKIQGLWNYATSGNSGKWSTAQAVYINEPNFGMVFRRHRLRGQGLVLQIKVKSVDGEAFDIMGWSAFENQNTGV